MKLIAETAWHHDGDFDFFKKLVKEISTKTNTDYVKFHITLDVDEYIYKDHPGYTWVRNSIFLADQWQELINIVLRNNKKPMLLFNDTKAIDFGIQFDPELVEIHSVCLNDYNLLNHLKKTKKERTKIVLGIGGNDLYEVENAIRLLGTDNIVLMHGFQNYPTKYEDINFSKIRRIMNMFPNYEHGYADHTAWDNKNNTIITLLGASLGMNYVEKHTTFATGEGRTDWQAAISIEDFNDLEKKLRISQQANGDGLLRMNLGEKTYSTFGIMKKAPILSRDVKNGELLTWDNISFKRTGQSSDLSQLDIINKMGKAFVRDLKCGYCINSNDLAK
jgi:sialic acid synthase SpsE